MKKLLIGLMWATLACVGLAQPPPPLASQAQAVAGTNNFSYMSPLRVAQAMGGGGGAVSGTTGTFSSLTSGRVVFVGAGGLLVDDADMTFSVDTLSVAKGIFGGSTSLLLGTAGSLVGSVGFRNATSGTITLAPPTGALGTVTATLFAATDTIVGKATTDILTNKAITPRVISTTDDATAVIDVALTDVYQLTAVANATTFSTTGSPVDGQRMMIRFKDAGVAKGLTWDAVFAVIGVTLPTTTVAGKWHYVGVVYNSTSSKWDVLAVAVQA